MPCFSLFKRKYISKLLYFMFFCFFYYLKRSFEISAGKCWLFPQKRDFFASEICCNIKSSLIKLTAYGALLGTGIPFVP